MASKDDLFGGMTAADVSGPNPYALETAAATSGPAADAAAELLAGADTTAPMPDAAPSPRSATGGTDDGEGGSMEEGKAGEPEMDLELEGLNLTASAEKLESQNLAELSKDLEVFRQNEMVREALNRNVDLRAYESQIAGDLHREEQAAVQACLKEAQRFATLYTEIGECEDVLGEIEGLLGSFQGRLASVSDEIRHLQTASTENNVKLRNRRQVGSAVGMFLDRVAVTPEASRTIERGAIDNAFEVELESLSRKIDYADSHGAASRGDAASAASSRPAADPGVASAAPAADAAAAAAAEEVAVRAGEQLLRGMGRQLYETNAARTAMPEIERLRGVASVRCRDYLLAAIDQCRRPRTDFAKMRHHTVTARRGLMRFLSRHAPDMAQQVRSQYIEVVGAHLQSLLQAYLNGLKPLEEQVAGATDLVGKPSGTRLVSRGFFTSRAQVSKGPEVFRAVGRERILHDTSSPAVAVDIARRERVRLPTEMVFRHLQRHLLDAAEAEYTFCLSFFGAASSSGSLEEAARNAGPGLVVFQTVMAKPINAVLNGIEALLYSCHDAVALLLMLGVTLQQRLGGGIAEAVRAVGPAPAGAGANAGTTAGTTAGAATGAESGQRDSRRPGPPGCLMSPVMVPYFNRVTMLLWPRFKSVFDANMQSLKSAAPGSLAAVEVAPHDLSLRFASFISSVLKLTHGIRDMEQRAREAGIDVELTMSGDMLDQTLAMMRSEFERVLALLAGRLPDKLTRVAFLVLNYHAVVHGIESQGVPVGEASHLVTMRRMQQDFFVEEVLRAHLLSLANFVQETLATARQQAGVEAEPSSSLLLEETDALPEGVRPECDRQVVESLVRGFRSTWQETLRAIQHHCMSLFRSPPAPAGLDRELLQLCVTQTLRYYMRLGTIVSRSLGTNSPVARELVSLPVIYQHIQEMNGARGAAGGGGAAE